MFQYNYINLPSFQINEIITKKIFSEISSYISLPQNGQVNIVFVSWDEIQNLNKTYRNKDTLTDVLSFHYFDDFSHIWEDDIAWELVFCEEKILLQWQEYWLWSEKEFYKLLIHSLLHILWYDHEIDSEYEVMQNLENQIWNKIFEK